MIPSCCPSCKEKNRWKEDINPFTTGILIGKHIRICLAKIQGIQFYEVTYRCGNCGFEGKYDYRDKT